MKRLEMVYEPLPADGNVVGGLVVSHPDTGVECVARQRLVRVPASVTIEQTGYYFLESRDPQELEDGRVRPYPILVDGEELETVGREVRLKAGQVVSCAGRLTCSHRNSVRNHPDHAMSAEDWSKPREHVLVSPAVWFELFPGSGLLPVPTDPDWTGLPD